MPVACQQKHTKWINIRTATLERSVEKQKLSGFLQVLPPSIYTLKATKHRRYMYIAFSLLLTIENDSR